MIDPGKTEDVKVTIATGPKRGKLSRTITLTTNDRDNTNVKLECEADIQSALKCEPENVAFPPIKRSETRVEKTVKITRGSAGPIHPKLGSIGNPQITADLREIEPGESYELQVVAQPPWPANGAVRANLPIETGIEKSPTETIMVSGIVLPRAQVSPRQFTLRPGTSSDLRLVARLNWDDDHPGKITEATVNDEALKVGVEDQDNQQVIVLNVPAGYGSERRRGTQVTVKTDDPAVPSLSIPVFVMATASGPSAVLSPDAQRVNPAMLRPTAHQETPAASRQPAATPVPTTGPSHAR
jgi:hypothetical protein